MTRFPGQDGLQLTDRLVDPGPGLAGIRRVPRRSACRPDERAARSMSASSGQLAQGICTANANRASPSTGSIRKASRKAAAACSSTVDLHIDLAHRLRPFDATRLELLQCTGTESGPQPVRRVDR